MEEAREKEIENFLKDFTGKQISEEPEVPLSVNIEFEDVSLNQEN